MSVLKNIVTFGASGRIENKLEDFEDMKLEYESLYRGMEVKREETNTALEELIGVKVSAVKALNKINSISKKLKSRDREVIYRKFGNDFEIVDFERVDDTLTNAKIALNTTKGVSTGVGTALGTWALVSTYGAASTGTAISALSGAAATNATLAWLGGGSLAIGGGGMAAGTAVIGGIVALPALALTGIFSHMSANKQIKEIEIQMNKILKAVDDVKANKLRLELTEERAVELTQAIERTTIIFKEELKKTHKDIYPIPVISRSIKWTKKNIFRKSYFSKQDIENISYIGGMASDFAAMIDSKIFED